MAKLERQIEEAMTAIVDAPDEATAMVIAGPMRLAVLAGLCDLMYIESMPSRKASLVALVVRVARGVFV